ncbi:metallo-beta-lactamase family protein [Desulfohalotomaculum tongense]|uniref:MBL fold metallo-hydrolase RNA specificity domain-containing protein n=1 Tax=Desulforadius tongensis TaxID=1216062 RepID=UPI00195DB2C4|nr:MBL fold metallo-hydrolase [Desulforadius tongensis]MBM7855233.1 metallo-beta-lactamase family protein [Desulforadius tongensis]
MRIKFLGAAQVVTGSCYLLEVGSSKILIDCGLFQGSKELKERNYRDFPIPPGSIDFVLLTHAHIDHSGLLPKLIKHGFRGRVITTSATADLCEVMLPDAGHIQEMECERKNRKNRRAGRKLIEPIYTAEDGLKAMQYFERVEYGDIISITPQVTVRFLDAGHILGSSMIEIWVKEGQQETKLVFSGDIGNYDQPFINDPSLIFNADYVFMESTYGNRLHKHKDNKAEMLKKAINDTYKKGGNLIIPAFAVGRTQDIIYEIAELQREGAIPILPVYIDSPMAVKATEIFNRHPNVYDEETSQLISQGKHPLRLDNLHFSVTAEESKALNTKTGSHIIISASGMCDAGRIKHHLRHNLWRPEATILIVGYQAMGTLGRRLVSGEKLVRIHGEEVAVRAEIRNIDGYSAHADQAGLLDWLRQFKKPPRRVFLVHGEAEGAEELAEIIRRELNIPTTVPELMQEVELTVGEIAYPDMLRETYNKVSRKLERYLQTDVDSQECAVLLQQLRDLERWLDSVI